MCLILDIPIGADPLSSAEFDDVWRKNPHGICVLERVTGEILYRGRDAITAEATTVGQTGIVVHWRHATSGPKDNRMVHGWRVGERARLLHNGVLPGAWGDTTISDTADLVVTLRALGADLVDPRWDPMLRGVVGSGVIVIVGRDDAPAWIGARAPHVWRGRAYSNRYAWTGTIHGEEPPPIVPTRARRGRRDAPDEGMEFPGLFDFVWRGE